MVATAHLLTNTFLGGKCVCGGLCVVCGVWGGVCVCEGWRGVCVGWSVCVGGVDLLERLENEVGKPSQKLYLNT